MTESLPTKAAPLNITSIIVESSGFRTCYLNTAVTLVEGLAATYQGTTVIKQLRILKWFGESSVAILREDIRWFRFVTGIGVAEKEEFRRLSLGLNCVMGVES